MILKNTLLLSTLILTLYSCSKTNKSDLLSSLGASDNGSSEQQNETSISYNSYWKQLGSTTLSAFNSSYSANGSDKCYQVIVDSSGNNYCAGLTSSNLAENVAGSFNAMVIKSDKDGDLKWVRHLGSDYMTNNSLATSSRSDSCESITEDDSSIYCVGNTNLTIVSGESNYQTLNKDIFVWKMNKSDGQTIWIKQLGTNFSSTINGNTNAQDEVKKIIYHKGSLYLFGVSDSDLTNINAGSNLSSKDPFMIKMDTDSNVDWIKHYSTNYASATGNDVSGVEQIVDVKVDSEDNFIIAGNTSGSFGGSHAGADDIFILKVNDQGNFVWVRQFDQDFETDFSANAQSSESLRRVALDSSDNIYLSLFTLGSLASSSSGTYDIAVAKINNSGAIQWVNQLGAAEASAIGLDSTSHEVAIDVFLYNNQVYIAGYTTGSVSGTSAGGYDLFVVSANLSTGAFQKGFQFNSDYETSHGSINLSGNEELFQTMFDNNGSLLILSSTSSSALEPVNGSDDILIGRLSLTDLFND